MSIVKIGVLNGNGEWAVPLSENHKIIEQISDNGENIINILNGYVDVNWVEDSLLNILDIVTSIRLDDSDITTRIASYKGDNVFNICGVNYNADDDNIIDNADEKNVSYLNNTKYHKYTFESNRSVYGDKYYWRFLINNTDELYFSVFNSNNEQMFKPIKLESNIYDCECICVDEYGFVYKSGNEFSYYDIYGDKKCKYKNITYMEPFYEGLAFVKGDNDMGRFIDKTGKTIIE